jgi:hypothetical protein
MQDRGPIGVTPDAPDTTPRASREDVMRRAASSGSASTTITDDGWLNG